MTCYENSVDVLTHGIELAEALRLGVISNDLILSVVNAHYHETIFVLEPCLDPNHYLTNQGILFNDPAPDSVIPD